MRVTVYMEVGAGDAEYTFSNEKCFPPPIGYATPPVHFASLPSKTFCIDDDKLVEDIQRINNRKLVFLFFITFSSS